MSLSSLTTAVVLLALCAWGMAASYINHDPAWYLHVAEAWLRGATLYRDVVDTNPPLIVWLSTPPVALAMLTGSGAPALFKAYVFVVAAAMLALTGRVARKLWPDIEVPLVIAAAFLCLAFAREDFGQREHFAVLLTLPYILEATASAERLSRRTSILIGVLGGIGFAIKPHFFFAWIAVESAVLVLSGRRALRRPALLASLLTVAAYGAAVLILTPQYLGVVERVRQVYGALNTSTAQLLRTREVLLWGGGLAVLGALRWGAQLRLLLPIFAAGTGYLLAALLQGKGWPYQFYPARVFLLLFCAALAASLLHLLPGVFALLRGGRRAAGVIFAAMILTLSARYALEARNPRFGWLVARMIEAIETHAGDGPVALLAMRTHIYPAFPAISYTDAKWSLRYNAMFFLPAFYVAENSRSGGALPPHPPGQMPSLERAFFDDVVEDLCARPPRLLIVEQPPLWTEAGQRGLDLVVYYRQSERAAGLLARYSPQGGAGAYVFMVPDGQPSCGNPESSPRHQRPW